VAEGALFCGACRTIQPVGPNEDHFSILGLPRRYAVDRAELDRSFRERSRLLHPDRFARAEPRVKRISLERATRLNDACRCIKDWRLRAAYLLELAGVDVLSAGRSFADPGFLEEQLEWREGLALAVADGDAERLRRIAGDARERLRDVERDVAERLEHPERIPEQSIDIARRLSRATYYDAIVADAERAVNAART
jgi:molecular chaperone HscB